MTRKVPPKSKSRSRPSAAGAGRSSYWPLQDAKAKFSELVRRVRSDGPQHVTLHGVDTVVVISAELFRKLKGEPTGERLIEVMQSSPLKEIELQPPRTPMPVRDISL
jgi:prevent-host-death family protein